MTPEQERQNKIDVINEKISELMPEHVDFDLGVNGLGLLNTVKNGNSPITTVLRDRNTREVYLADADSNVVHIEDLSDSGLRDLYASLLTNQMWELLKTQAKKKEISVPTPFEFTFEPVYGSAGDRERINVDRISLDEGSIANKDKDYVSIFLHGKNEKGEETNPSFRSMSFASLYDANQKLDDVAGEVYDIYVSGNLSQELIDKRNKLIEKLGPDFHWHMDNGEEKYAIPLDGNPGNEITGIVVTGSFVLLTAYMEESNDTEYVPLASLTKDDWHELMDMAPSLRKLAGERPQNYVPSTDPVISDLMEGLNSKVINPYHYEKMEGTKIHPDETLYNIRYDGLTYHIGILPEKEKDNLHEIRFTDPQNRLQAVTVSSTTWEAILYNIKEQDKIQQEIHEHYENGVSQARTSEEGAIRRLIRNGEDSANEIRGAFKEVSDEYQTTAAYEKTFGAMRDDDTYEKDWPKHSWQVLMYSDGLQNTIKADMNKFNELYEPVRFRKDGVTDSVKQLFPGLKNEHREHKYYTNIAYMSGGNDEDGHDFSAMEDNEDWKGIEAAAREKNTDEIDYNDTWRDRPDHYNGDSIVTQDGDLTVVVNNSVGGDYSVWKEYSESQLRDRIANDGLLEKDMAEIDFSTGLYTSDIKDLIHTMKTEQHEADLAEKLGENFHWESDGPHSAITSGDIYHRTFAGEPYNIVTSVDIKDGALTLRDGDGKVIDNKNLTKTDWDTLDTFADSRLREMKKVYNPVVEVYDVYGKRDGKTELVATNLSSKEAYNMVKNSKEWASEKGYDTLYSEQKYFVANQEDRFRNKNRKDGRNGRWHSTATPEHEMYIQAGFEIDKVMNNPESKAMKIAPEYFVPDPDIKRALIMSAYSENRDYKSGVFFDTTALHTLGLSVDQNAKPVRVPITQFDGSTGVQELYPLESTNIQELAAKDSKMATIYQGNIYNAEQGRKYTLESRIGHASQLDYINSALRDKANNIDPKEFLADVNDEYKAAQAEERERYAVISDIDNRIENKDNYRFDAYLPGGTTSKDEIILEMDLKNDDHAVIYNHPNGAGVIHYDNADKETSFEGRQSWYDFASEVYDSPDHTLEPKNDINDRRDEDRGGGLKL